jgi:hypothetical protein
MTVPPSVRGHSNLSIIGCHISSNPQSNNVLFLTPSHDSDNMGEGVLDWQFDLLATKSSYLQTTTGTQFTSVHYCFTISYITLGCWLCHYKRIATF